MISQAARDKEEADALEETQRALAAAGISTAAGSGPQPEASGPKTYRCRCWPALTM